MSEWTGRRLSIKIRGASHEKQITLEMTGFPAGIRIDREALTAFLARRAPGRADYATSRREDDIPQFESGLDDALNTDGNTLRAVIENRDARPQDYDPYRALPRPGHADLTAKLKYGMDFDMRGGGPFSGRMTAPLCVAGGFCLQYLEKRGIRIAAHLKQIADILDDEISETAPILPFYASGEFPVLNKQKGERMRKAIQEVREAGDSLGGVIECAAVNVPCGLGGPLFDGLEGKIAALLFAIPAVKGVSFGAGFGAARLHGSENNDAIYREAGTFKTRTNHAGGILGGISSGMPLIFQAAIKPTPSIARPQETVDLITGEKAQIALTGRHDACIAPRAVPVVEAAAAIALCDEMLEAEK